MSSEPVAAPPATTEPGSGIGEKKVEAVEAVEAAEARSTTAPAPAAVEKPEAIVPDSGLPAEEKKVEAAPAEEKKSEPVPSDEHKSEGVPVEEKKTLVTTPLQQLLADLPSIIKQAEHGEIWGVKLGDGSHVPTTIVLEKFLRANTRDVTKAKAQLIEALKWRKKIDPAKLLNEVEFDKSKFGDLGYVTVYPQTDSHAKEIVTWNIYGAVKDNKATFGNVEE